MKNETIEINYGENTQNIIENLRAELELYEEDEPLFISPSS